MEIATLAGGCFWCTEAIFKRLKGVTAVISGYAGGDVKNPTYHEISAGQTGHAESIKITFNPKVISYQEILGVFWHLHDPTTINRQGSDSGTQYRSIIFYHSQKQKRMAEQSKRQIAESGLYKDPIVTQIVPYTTFYKAEDYHQNYYERNKDYPYCKLMIDPKLQKLMTEFKDVTKPQESRRSIC